MSLRHALLGLLAEEPASGYELTGKFENILQRYAWHAKNSQIYPELRQLATDGLASVIENGPRRRQTYAITEAGRAELRRWMLNPPDVFVVRNEFVLRLFLLAAVEPDEARALLARVAADSAEALDALREQVDKFDATAEPAPGTGTPLNRLVAEYGLRSFQTLHDWARWARERIGQAEPNPAALEPGGRLPRRPDADPERTVHAGDPRAQAKSARAPDRGLL
jgi:DNA-binding PadR family transcriptional regulator